MALVHGIGIHDPRHHPLVGVHVGRRDVAVGAEGVDDRRGVAAGDPLELPVGHRRRIADHAALGAAEGHVHHRALPRHPGGEGLHFVEGDLHVEPDAALGRAARRVVEHPVAGVDLHLTVVPADGHRDDDLFFGVREHLVEARIEVELLRGDVETRDHRLVGILFGAGEKRVPFLPHHVLLGRLGGCHSSSARVSCAVTGSTAGSASRRRRALPRIAPRPVPRRGPTGPPGVPVPRPANGPAISRRPSR